jgi:hypothetical protein
VHPGGRRRRRAPPRRACADIGAAARQPVGVIAVPLKIVAPGAAPKSRRDLAPTDFDRLEFAALFFQALCVTSRLGPLLRLTYRSLLHHMAILLDCEQRNSESNTRVRLLTLRRILPLTMAECQSERSPWERGCVRHKSWWIFAGDAACFRRRARRRD